MANYPGGLRRDEQVSYVLRGLFESRGYKRYKSNRFEEYGLYLENKSFLPAGNVVTFNSPDGRLLALRPDVTLSIAKNTKATRTSGEKLYYIEDVCRLSPRAMEYEEISQMGLEYFGGIDNFAVAEVIGLALRSLAEIDEDFVLDISHMGFMGRLLEMTVPEEDARAEILDCICQKNVHDLKKLAEKAGVSPADADRLGRAASLYGTFGECLPAAREIADGDAGLLEAVGELENIYGILSELSLSGNMRLDFSIVNDIAYYNNVIFQGYVRRIPRAVLSGGRYDNLLSRFGHDAGAVGFALYLNEISSRYTDTSGSDVDVFILYDDSADMGALLNKTDELAAAGKRVRAERNIPEELRCGTVCRFADGELKEVARDA
ncbi:MAG: ATP phosphoribosyltransferase regulatory subunit [Oscillospiraceae bacterium]|nr:ATP phosphoribosyltransferase regulatory subunit [Oscillospiraceae bacterium]